MVELIASPAAWLFCISSRPTPLASEEWVDQGRRGWVLLNNTNRPRKKIVTKLNNFIIDYASYSTYNAPKMMVLHFPHTSRSSHLPSILPSVAAACFWLVVAFQISISGRIRQRRIFVILFVRGSVHPPKQWNGVSPCALPPTRLRSNNSILAFADSRLIVVCHHQTAAT